MPAVGPPARDLLWEFKQSVACFETAEREILIQSRHTFGYSLTCP